MKLDLGTVALALIMSVAALSVAPIFMTGCEPKTKRTSPPAPRSPVNFADYGNARFITERKYPLIQLTQSVTYVEQGGMMAIGPEGQQSMQQKMELVELHVDPLSIVGVRATIPKIELGSSVLILNNGAMIAVEESHLSILAMIQDYETVEVAD